MDRVVSQSDETEARLLEGAPRRGVGDNRRGARLLPARVRREHDIGDERSDHRRADPSAPERRFTDEVVDPRGVTVDAHHGLASSGSSRVA